MNKKFLSAILFGALMVTSTGTFVSCKDYDEEIEDLQGQISANTTAIAELQKLVGAGNWVTNITKAEGGINVAFSNGTTSFVATGAVVETEECYASAATIVDGEWVINKADGTSVETGIPASGVLVTGDEATGYVLSIVNAAGDVQEVKLPTAASSLTDLIVTADNNKLSFANYTYKGEVKIADWKGPRTLPADEKKTVNILASVDSPVVQLNPTTVDGEAIEFSLVDSKNNVPTYITLKAKPYTELVLSKAANANGLYSLSMEEVVVPEKINDFLGQFTKDKTPKLYAIAAGNVRSEYKVTVSEGKNAVLSTIGVKDANGDFVKTNTTGNDCVIYAGGKLSGTVSTPDIKVAANEWYDVVAVDAAAALYDMHLSVSDDDKTLFGVEFKEEAGSYQFRLTATPDNITKAGFQLSIETISMTGEHKTAYLWVGQNSVIAEGVTYDAIEHEVKTVASDKNFFSISLDKMKNALGAEGLALWNKVATESSVTYLDADGEEVKNATGINLVFVEELKDKVSTNKAATYSKATNLVFDVTKAAADYFEPNEQYTAVITFTNAEGETLNSISVPFTFTLPALSTMFEIDPGFVKEGVTNLYLYEADKNAVHKDISATFMLDRVFSKYEAGYTIALDDETEIGETEMTSAELAHLNSQASETKDAKMVTIKEKTLAYVTLTGKLGEEAGYGEELNFIISGEFDGVWGYPEGEEFTFKAKIMSPIKEGKITPKEGSAVTIKASDLDGFKFGNELIIGQTYNSEVTYKVLQDAVGGWTRKDIKGINAESGNKNYFEVKETKNAVTGTEADEVVEGYFLLEGYNVDHTVETTMTIEVTDIWERTIVSEVPVKITVAE